MNDTKIADKIGRENFPELDGVMRKRINENITK